jgi:hypothetical protein
LLVVERLSLKRHQYGYLVLGGTSNTILAAVESLRGTQIVLFLDEFDTSFVGYFEDVQVVLCQHGVPISNETLLYGTGLLRRRMPVRLLPMCIPNSPY